MDQDQLKFIELRAFGCIMLKISNEIGVSKPTLIKWLKKFENEIENTRSIEIESIKEKFNVSRHTKSLWGVRDNVSINLESDLWIIQTKQSKQQKWFQHTFT